MKMPRGFVAYLDVLGFKNLLETNPSEIPRIYELLDSAIGTADESNLSGTHIQYVGMSDSVVAFLAPKAADASSPALFVPLRSMVSAIRQIQRECAASGILIRGALTFGEFSIHESKQTRSRIVSGPALVQAYQLEREDRYPRVTIDGEVFKAVKSYERETFFHSLMSKKHHPSQVPLLFDWRKSASEASSHRLPDGRELNIPGPKEDCISFVDYLSQVDEPLASELINKIRVELSRRHGRVFKKWIWLRDYLAYSIVVSPYVPEDLKNNLLQELAQT